MSGSIHININLHLSNHLLFSVGFLFHCWIASLVGCYNSFLGALDFYHIIVYLFFIQNRGSIQFWICPKILQVFTRDRCQIVAFTRMLTDAQTPRQTSRHLLSG